MNTPGLLPERGAATLEGVKLNIAPNVSAMVASTIANDVLSYRVLVVEDTDLAQGEARVVLRKRDFRFALLNRSDLRRADLVWADLRSAQMSKTRVDKGKLKTLSFRALI